MFCLLGGLLLAISVAYAHVDAKDKDGRTALMKAAREGHTDIVNLLKEHGASE